MSELSQSVGDHRFVIFLYVAEALGSKLMQKLIKSLLFVTLLTLGLGPVSVRAFSPDDAAQISILPGWRTDQGTWMTALYVDLSPGWKTYWRAPGAGGIPPRFDWSGSRNIEAVLFHWPVPEVSHINDLRTIGYAHELVLPIEITPRKDGDIRLRSTVEIGVCEDICIPLKVKLRADLSGDGATDRKIHAALAARPDTADEAGVRAVTCRVEPISDGMRLTADLALPSLGGVEAVAMEFPDHGVWISEPTASRDGMNLRTIAEMVPPNAQPFSLDRSKVRITVFGAGRAVDIQGCSL